MAKRPIFVPHIEGSQLVHEVFVDFEWVKGLAPSQKRKNIASLHKSAQHQKDIFPILEVSTKSEEQIGVSLSAFNLVVETEEYGIISLESAFQGSKVFSSGGPFVDLYGKKGTEIKKDVRLRGAGKLVKFTFEGEIWDIEPKTAFYDWLYLHSVIRLHIDDDLQNYKGFTDIEYNPQKSINCQARSCALYISLFKRENLEIALKNKQYFIELLERDSLFQSHSKDKRQGNLLFIK